MTDQATQDCTDSAAMGAITDAHRKLEPFVGTFRAEVKMWMGPGDPHVSTGTMTNTLELGSRFLQQDYRGDASDGALPDFEGRGFWGYITTANKYEGFWIDTACTSMQTDSGDVDAAGKVWTMIGEMTCPQTGDKMQKKSIITFAGPDHHSIEMFFITADGNERKGMEIQYTRA